MCEKHAGNEGGLQPTGNVWKYGPSLAVSNVSAVLCRSGKNTSQPLTNLPQQITNTRKTSDTFIHYELQH